MKNTLDADGSLSQVQSKKSGDTYRNFANGFIYNAAGAVSAMKLGNGKWENTTFNSRLQPTQIGLGNGVASQNLLKLEYSYGTTQNNGNVLSQTITVNRTGQSDLVFDQTYTYDSLNRITSAEEKTGTTTNWLQTYTFDRYGNRNFNEALTTTLPKNCGTSPNYTVCTADVPIVNPSVTTGNNRLTGTTYDAAGNVIVDAEGREFTYDAENKQIQAENSSSTILGTYYFDGDGKRVKKIVPGTGETTIFVYDASGKLIAEYSTIVASPQDAKTQYLTNDHLGTPRINTDATGQVVSRSDYMPYGEEIISIGGRSSNDEYVADEIRQDFTGHEQDDETSLIYAKARNIASTLGRFNSPDPVGITKEHIVDPRYWNLYIYAVNSPLIMIDLDGQFPWTFHIRSFIQTSSVGAGLYRGDGRGPSTSTDPGVASSRVRVRFTLDYERSRVTEQSVESDPSVLYYMPGTVGPVVKRGSPSAEFSAVAVSGDSKGVGLHYWGKDPIPGIVTPNLDVHAGISISETKSKFGNGVLKVTGSVSGDGYPSTEAFVVDQSGKNKVFLGAKMEEGNVGTLYGDHKKPLFKVDVQIKFDRKGNFTAVIHQGKTYTIEAWNKKVEREF